MGEKKTRRRRCVTCAQLRDPSTMVDGQCYTCRQVSVTVEVDVKDVEPVTYGQRQQTLADRLRAQKDTGVDKAPHLIVIARAGTGKTTTLVEGLKRVKGLPSPLTPSPQQAAVWKQMELSRSRAQTICFCCFNRSIKGELEKRVPEGCDAMTMHSMGFKAIGRAFPDLRIKVDDRYTEEIVARLTGKDIWELRRKDREMLNAVCQLVDLCKMNLTGFFGTTGGFAPGKISEQEELGNLARHYDVDLNGMAARVFDLVPRVLEESRDVAKHGTITYADMIWLPVVLNLNVYRYDLLLVDEAQDLNQCQQALAKKAGRRLILCGDPRQAIYGFAGADAQSMSQLEDELSRTERGCVHLPLTVTRRCSKAVVLEAQRIVPDFSAHEGNPAGIVSCMGLKSYSQSVQDGDMVLCRCNAPLVSECFRFLKAGRKANIQGRDVGAGLIRTVEKVMKGYMPTYSREPIDVTAGDPAFSKGGEGSSDRIEQVPGPVVSDEIIELHRRLDNWLHGEERKENAKRNPSDQRIINLRDKYDCIICFTEDARTVEDVLAKINAVFTDDKESVGIRLSSIHKAKGLESDRVFFLMPKEAPCPHPMAKLAWEREQEMNLKYVAITRAINELVYVTP